MDRLGPMLRGVGYRRASEQAREAPSSHMRIQFVKTLVAGGRSATCSGDGGWCTVARAVLHTIQTRGSHPLTTAIPIHAWLRLVPALLFIGTRVSIHPSQRAAQAIACSVGSLSVAPTLAGLDPVACLAPVSLETSRGLAVTASKRENLKSVLNSEAMM